MSAHYPTEFDKRQPVGDNPPPGAIIDYYFKSAPKDEVTLDVLDAQRKGESCKAHLGGLAHELELGGYAQAVFFKRFPDLAVDDNFDARLFRSRGSLAASCHARVGVTAPPPAANIIRQWTPTHARARPPGPLRSIRQPC